MSAERMPIDTQLAGLSDPDQRLLESWLVEFDQSWTKRRLGEWEQRLPPPGERLRRVALVEMVRIDLKRRWQLGQRANLESYLKVLPELGTPETVSPELILAEYKVAIQFGAGVGPEEYAKRFPRQIEAIRSLMEQTRCGPAQETIAQAPTAVISGPVETQSGAPQSVPPVELHLAETLPYTPRQSVTRVEPKKLGRYRLLRRLGQGGMGAVYLAEDTQLDRKVALKVPHFGPDDPPDALERFYREARAAATIEHPNLCRVYDVGAIDGIHFLTMEYIEGIPLSSLLKDGKLLTPRQIAVFVRKLALSLQETHDRGVIHRDLKPANIMINRRGEPVIVDFGLARRFNSEEARLTQGDTILGTPAYMPPEQFDRTLQEPGPRSDIYSLGVILYELLTGRLPFQGTMVEIMARIVVDEPEPPTSFRPDLDPQLESICLKAMSKKAGDRFPTMGEFAARLGDYLADTSLKPGPPSAAPGPGHSGVPGTTEMVSEAHLLALQFATLVTDEESDLTPSPRRSTVVRRPRKPPIWPWAAAASAAALLLLAGALAFRNTTDQGERASETKTAIPKVQGGVTPAENRVASVDPMIDPEAESPTKPQAGAVGAAPDLPPERPESPPVVPQSAPKPGAVAAREGFAVEAPSPVLVGADTTAYQAWLDRMRAAGYRPTFVNSHDRGGGPRFAAIAMRYTEDLPWESRLDANPENYQKTFDELKQRCRLIGISGHPLGDTTGYASLWVGGPGRSWLNYPSCSLQEYRTRLEEATSKGFMPTCVAGFPNGDSSRLAVIFGAALGTPWLSREGLGAAEFQAALDEERLKGYRPISAAAYPDSGAIRFAVVMARDPRPRKWEERHGMSAAELRQELERRQPGDSRLAIVSGYLQEGESRYLAVWAQDVFPDGERFTIEGRSPILVGADIAACQAWFDRMRAEGYRPTYASSYDGGDGPRFAAIAVRNTENLPWEARLDASQEAYLKTFHELKAKYRPLSISRHALGSKSGHVSLWIGGPNPGWLAYGLDLKPYQTKLKELASDGMVPINVSVDTRGDSHHITVISIPAKGIPSWFSREGLSAQQFEGTLSDGRARGFRPMTAIAYPDGGAVRFAVIMAQDPSVQAWNARQGLSSAQLRKEINDGRAKGYQPVEIWGYRQDGGWRYLAIWVKPTQAE